MSDILKLLYVILRAVKRVKFETILKYHNNIGIYAKYHVLNHAIINLFIPLPTKGV